MIDSPLFEKLLKQSYRFLSYRPRSFKEVKTYLKKKTSRIAFDNGKVLVLNIIQQLEKEGLIDDRQFVVWWVRQRQDFRPKSQRVMMLELKHFGIEDDLIKEVFEQERGEFKSDEEMVKELLSQWLKKNQSLPEKDFKKKFIPYLYRRGFSWPAIQTAIDKVLHQSVD